MGNRGREIKRNILFAITNYQLPIAENYDIISSSLKQCWVKNVETKLSTPTNSALKNSSLWHCQLLQLSVAQMWANLPL